MVWEDSLDSHGNNAGYQPIRSQGCLLYDHKSDRLFCAKSFKVLSDMSALSSPNATGKLN